GDGHSSSTSIHQYAAGSSLSAIALSHGRAEALSIMRDIDKTNRPKATENNAPMSRSVTELTPITNDKPNVAHSDKASTVGKKAPAKDYWPYATGKRAPVSLSPLDMMPPEFGEDTHGSDDWGDFATANSNSTSVLDDLDIYARPLQTDNRGR